MFTNIYIYIYISTDVEVTPFFFFLLLKGYAAGHIADEACVATAVALVSKCPRLMDVPNNDGMRVSEMVKLPEGWPFFNVKRFVRNPAYFMKPKNTAESLGWSSNAPTHHMKHVHHQCVLSRLQALFEYDMLTAVRAIIITASPHIEGGSGCEERDAAVVAVCAPDDPSC